VSDRPYRNAFCNLPQCLSPPIILLVNAGVMPLFRLSLSLKRGDPASLTPQQPLKVVAHGPRESGVALTHLSTRLPLCLPPRVCVCVCARAWRVISTASVVLHSSSVPPRRCDWPKHFHSSQRLVRCSAVRCSTCLRGLHSFTTTQQPTDTFEKLDMINSNHVNSNNVNY
jgi:hypothetical protein